MISTSFASSSLFRNLTHLEHTKNMRTQQDPHFVSFFQTMGDGTAPYVDLDKICIPSKLIFPFVDLDTSPQVFIDTIFPNLHFLPYEPNGFVDHAIILATNDVIDTINELLVNKIPGPVIEYVGTDKTKDAFDQGKYEDLLNILIASGLPP